MPKDEPKDRYECPECHLRYRDAAWAKKCEAWCQKYHSCNLEIVFHAEPADDDATPSR
jgi:hypothetical protein